MARIYNPNIAVTSVPISIRIIHQSVSNNAVTELYYDTFDLFMNSQTPSPYASVYLPCNNWNACWNVNNNDISDVSWFRFYPTNMGGLSASGGYYYALDLTTDFLPMSR